MHGTPVPPEGLSIRRHVVQQLLRQALDAAPNAAHGLLGGNAQRVEAALALHDAPSSDTVRKTLQAWRSKGIRLLATYCSGDAEGRMPVDLLPEEKAARIKALPQLRIRTDTRGRIEADLLAPAVDGGSHSCLLEMQEDGGLYPLLDKG